MQASATYQPTNPTRSPARLLLVILALACAGVGVWTAANMAKPGERWQQVNVTITNVIVDPAYGHGDARHPTEAPRVRECLNKRGPYMTFMISREMKRFLRVCLMPDGKIGFQVVEQVGKEFREITAYVRQELRNLNDLANYIRKNGYCRYKGVIQ